MRKKMCCVWTFFPLSRTFYRIRQFHIDNKSVMRKMENLSKAGREQNDGIKLNWRGNANDKTDIKRDSAGKNKIRITPKYHA